MAMTVLDTRQQQPLILLDAAQSHLALAMLQQQHLHTTTPAAMLMVLDRLCLGPVQTTMCIHHNRHVVRQVMMGGSLVLVDLVWQRIVIGLMVHLLVAVMQ